MSWSLSHCPWRLKRQAALEERQCQEGGDWVGDEVKLQWQHTSPTPRQFLSGQSPSLRGMSVLAFGGGIKKGKLTKRLRHCVLHPTLWLRKLSLDALWICLKIIKGEVRIQTQVLLAKEKWSTLSELLEISLRLSTMCPEWSGSSWFKRNFIIFKKSHFLSMQLNVSIIGSFARIFSINSFINQKNALPDHMPSFQVRK